MRRSPRSVQVQDSLSSLPFTADPEPAACTRVCSLETGVTVRRAVHGNKAASDEIRAQAALLGV